VRGSDGEISLMGERGWLVRNDIGWAIPTDSGQSGAELYVGADYGLSVGAPPRICWDASGRGRDRHARAVEQAQL